MGSPSTVRPIVPAKSQRVRTATETAVVRATVMDGMIPYCSNEGHRGLGHRQPRPLPSPTASPPPPSISCTQARYVCNTISEGSDNKQTTPRALSSSSQVAHIPKAEPHINPQAQLLHFTPTVSVARHPQLQTLFWAFSHSTCPFREF